MEVDVVQRAQGRAMIAALLLMASAIIPRYADPPGLIVGVDARSVTSRGVWAGWPPAVVLRDDATSGQALRFMIPAATTFPGGTALGDISLYLLEGRLTIAGRSLEQGDFLRATQGAVLGRVIASANTTMLVFRNRPRTVAARPAVTVARGAAVAWGIGQVSRDAGAPALLMVKRLWTDPATGAQFHIVKVAPGVAVPWEVHPVAEEGYLIEGDFHLAECLPSGRRDFDYAPGGYFYRPPGLIHSGPSSTTRAGATWLIRTPARLSAIFYPACPAATASEETNR